MSKHSDLYKLWKNYVDSKILYRVISSEYVADIKKNGISPRKDPYKKMIPKIKKLLNLIVALEKKGFVHKQKWGPKVVGPRKIRGVSNVDMDKPYIDFTPHRKEVMYYLNYKGGALTTCVFLITSDIRNRNPSLTKKQKEFVEELYAWSKKKSSYKNKVLYCKGSARFFEKARFKPLRKKVYWVSPFGSFYHFKKVIEAYDWKRYEPYLTGKDWYNLRAVTKVPAKAILKIGNI
ncbi:hypothetical protein KY328_04685 [Candidatus Woesearchaeota archaeon]|nr:hypothetical protein [Candidatus Woesearchaeota archaeon]MBW3022194.1 hypothetical protein [Candidatus Woesearchaeota archaeon]